jgi:hypothetical protein
MPGARLLDQVRALRTAAADGLAGQLSGLRAQVAMLMGGGAASVPDTGALEAALLRQMDSPHLIERLIGGHPARLRALLRGRAAADPGLLVRPGGGRDPAWTIGFAWLDVLAATAVETAPQRAQLEAELEPTAAGHEEAGALIRAAFEAWLADPSSALAGKGGAREPAQRALARHRAARLVRLAPHLASPAVWFRTQDIPALADRVRADLAAVADQAGRTREALAQAQLRLGLCAVAAALPGAHDRAATARLWLELAASVGLVLDQGGVSPARLQRLVADLDMLAGAQGEVAGEALADLVPRLVHVLRLLTWTRHQPPAPQAAGETGAAERDSASPLPRPAILLADFGSGPGDPVLNEAFCGLPDLDCGTAELRGTGCGYGRADCAGTTVWLGLPPGAGGAAALEIATRDGLILTTGPRTAPFGPFQIAGDRAVLATAHGTQRRHQADAAPLSVRIRESTEAVILETVARAPDGQAAALRRISILRHDGSIEGCETLREFAPGANLSPAAAAENAARHVLQFFSASSVRCSVSRDGRSIIFSTNCGTAWRLRSKGLDFHCTSGFARLSQGGASGSTLVMGMGAGTGFRGLIELRWRLGRET